MSALAVDPTVEEFTSSLSSYARRNYGGQVSTADLHRAVALGWTPKELARHCSRELPTANAWRVIQSRLQWCATNPPKTTTERRPMKPHDCEQHPDRHVCPWLNETDANGAAVRCGCADEQQPVGRPA